MNAFTILMVAFASVVGLVFLTVIASLAAAGIFFLLPRLQQTWVALSLLVVAKHMAQVALGAFDQTTGPNQEEYAASICINPLKGTQYLAGMASRKPVFTANKADAKIVTDMMALKAWLAVLEEREGFDVYVCVPPPTKPATTERRLHV